MHPHTGTGTGTSTGTSTGTGTGIEAAPDLAEQFRGQIDNC